MQRLGVLVPLVILLWLTPHAAYAATLSGAVNDADGAPVADASVWLTQDRHARRTASAEDGSFAFDDIGIGIFELVALKDGYALGGMSAFAAGSAEVSLVLAKPGTASVRLIDRHGDPIGGARVKSMGVGGRFLVSVEDLIDTGFPALRSDDFGMVVFPFVPQGGHVQAIVQHHGFVDSEPMYLPVREKVVDVVLAKGLRLRGRVLLDDEPVGDARVSIFRQTPVGPREMTEVVSDADGLFYANLLPDTYGLVARHTAYASTPPVEVVLRSETAGQVHTVRLVEPRVLEGTILLPDGQGCGGAQVAYREGPVVYEDSYTDANGRFQFRVPAMEDGVLRVTPPPGYMPPFSDDMPIAWKDTRVLSLAPISLEEVPRVRGIVRMPDGEPASGVLVASLNLSDQVLAITGEDGKFELVLAKTPPGGVVLGKAEHGQRFLRQGFGMRLEDPEVVEVDLIPFEPKQDQDPDPTYRNKIAPLLNKEAPALDCDTWFNTEDLALEDLRGKVVVLSMWAGFDTSHMGLGRIHEMRALHALYADVEDVVVVGIHDSVSDAYEVGDFIQRYGIAYPVGRDTENTTFDRYGVAYIPQTVVIDKQGLVRYFQTEGRLLELIKVLRRR